MTSNVQWLMHKVDIKKSIAFDTHTDMLVHSTSQNLFPLLAQVTHATLMEAPFAERLAGTQHICTPNMS